MLDLLHPYLLDAVATSALHQTKTLLLHSSLSSSFDLGCRFSIKTTRGHRTSKSFGAL